MKHHRSLKEKLSESLPLSFKLSLKRALVTPVGAALRLAAGTRRAADRVIESAAARGLDTRGARSAPADTQPPRVPPFGASDFLFLMQAAEGRTAAADPADRPVRTSVVVHVHGEAESAFLTLRSLVREADFEETEVIVVNDASREDTRQLLSYFGGLVRVIDGNVGRGFADACNRGAAFARGRYLVFLGGDTAVLPGWLDNLLVTVEGGEQVGAVGPMLLDPRGSIREAGAIVWRDGEASPYGYGLSPDDRRLNFAREVDYCSGASLLVRRSLFERLGGFDPRYAPAGYEDADICMGVRSLGYKVIYQPLARAIRDGGATGAAGDDLVQRRAVNRTKFYEKWGGVLAREHLPPRADDAEPAANRKWATQVAVFDDLIPRPDRDAGSARMMFILRALSQWSHPVFITTGKSRWPEYEKLLWREGVETASVLDFGRLHRRRRFRAVVLSRPAVAGAMLGAVRRTDPELKIIYDMLDVHHIRSAREAALTGDARAAREAEALRRLETRLARAADLVWCGSPPDQEVMGRLAPGVPSVVVPTVHELHGRGRPFTDREHLLFVGNFSHRPNVDAIHFLAREVLPLVRRSLAGVELLVVGDNAPPEFAGYASGGVRLLGYVPDLVPIMSGCRVFVAPIRFGSGVNGKIGEALSYGLPVVTTTVGAEGWGFTDGGQVLIADAAGDFAAAVVRLYGDAALWQRLSDGGYRHIAENNTPEVVGRVINDSLRGGGAPRGEHARLNADGL